MLLIGFRVGEERYAIPGASVVEIVPRVALRHVPLAPPAVAGLFTYRGEVTPVVDLCRVMLDRDSRDSFTSRIVIVALPGDGASRPGRKIGLLAEQVNRVMEAPGAAQPALALPEAPFLGGVVDDDGAMVQVVDAGKLLPPALWDVLLPEGEPAP